jgi:hypothetical protein
VLSKVLHGQTGGYQPFCLDQFLCPVAEGLFFAIDLLVIHTFASSFRMKFVTLEVIVNTA